MKQCNCYEIASSIQNHKILLTAFILNGCMFLIGLVAGIVAHSSGLIADSLDMLADTTVYGLSILAITRSIKFKNNTAIFSSLLLFLLGLSVLFDAGYRAFLGNTPDSSIMLVIASISLAVNGFVLYLLRPYQQAEAHLKAAWAFTRVDIIANFSVLLSAILVIFTDSHYPDVIVGIAISLYVMKEAIQIMRNCIN